MSKFKYGVSKFPHVNEKRDSTHVVLGDGRTGVQSLEMTNGFAGVCFARDGGYDKPFGTNNNSEIHAADVEKVFIFADNVRSIDAVIEKLEEAKQFLFESQK